MWRRLDRFQSEATRYVNYFAERKEASVYTLMDEALLEYEEALRVILTLYELEFVQKAGNAGEKDINKYVYALTYKGLKYYLEYRRFGESREMLDNVIRLHSDKSIVLKYMDVFKDCGLDDYIVKSFRRMHEYRLPRGYLESIRYFQKPDNETVDAVEVLGLDYLVMEKDKMKKMLGYDYESQLKLFEVLRQIPELDSIQEKYFSYVEDRAQHVLDNIKKWRNLTGLY